LVGAAERLLRAATTLNRFAARYIAGT